MSTRLYKVVKEAIRIDPKIIVHEGSVSTHPGYSEEHFEKLGLVRNDLKRLERKGLALRGYTKNFWGPGETVNYRGQERVVKEKERFTGKGHKVRWILLSRGLSK